jgi:membrane-associated phospholipid phosphatase
MVAGLRRALPRGWKDFVLQLGVWFGFFFAYQIARGVADRNPTDAFQNGRSIIDLERHLHTLVEPDLQRVILHGGDWLVDSVNWTYWLSQFAVLGVCLLWIYFFRNEAFLRVRNWILAANVIALAGYVLLPTAPPRLFPDEGFVDTLWLASSFNHESGFVQLAANPYAAMPSVHAADALIIGFAMASLVRSRVAKALWTLWPTWVWFAVMATGNHYWLDVAAGVGVALLGATMVTWFENRRDPAGALVTHRRW